MDLGGRGDLSMACFGTKSLKRSRGVVRTAQQRSPLWSRARRGSASAKGEVARVRLDRASPNERAFPQAIEQAPAKQGSRTHPFPKEDFSTSAHLAELS
jgi:hypothetical protein